MQRELQKKYNYVILKVKYKNVDNIYRIVYNNIITKQVEEIYVNSLNAKFVSHYHSVFMLFVNCLATLGIHITFASQKVEVVLLRNYKKHH